FRSTRRWHSYSDSQTFAKRQPPDNQTGQFQGRSFWPWIQSDQDWFSYPDFLWPGGKPLSSIVDEYRQEPGCPRLAHRKGFLPRRQESWKRRVFQRDRKRRGLKMSWH